VISEYENFGVETSGGGLSYEPVRIAPVAICAVEGCLNPCESKSRQCRECSEQAKRIEMRLAMDPKAIASF
jgi:hypothetical protein